MGFVRNRARSLRPLANAGPVPVLALFTVRLAERLVPPLTALALAALVTEISPPVSPELFTAALVPILLLALVLLAGHLGESAAAPLEYLVKSRVDGAHRSRLARWAASTTSVAALESTEVQSMLREVRADPDHGVESTPGDGTVAALKWVCGLLGAAVTCGILLKYAWWALPLLLVPAVVNRTVRFRQSSANADRWRLAIKGELHADVWRNATVSPAEGKDVRVFGLTDWLVDRMQGHIREANEPLWSHIDRTVRSQWVSVALMVAGLLPVYLLVTADAVGGVTTVATQTAVLAAGWSLFQSLGSPLELHHMAGAVRVARSTARLGEVLATPAGDGAGDGVQTTTAVPERVRVIRFEDVRFAYPGTDREVLGGVDLEVRTDELLAVVGLNGAGKSTLIKLLCGLYRPTSGRITADGADVTAMDPEEWRTRLSVIFQDFNRYELSARENVLLGAAARNGAGTEEVRAAEEADLRAAASAAGFDPVLERLPGGWDTPLARSRTGGVDLSGGQWQQLTLTRALYAVRRGADLIVADEPTAHLDVRTEFELFDRLAERRRDTGIVLISHRLSTVRRADRIVLLEAGRITESGTHAELVARGGVYAEMFAVQARRFRTEGSRVEGDRAEGDLPEGHRTEEEQA